MKNETYQDPTSFNEALEKIRAIFKEYRLGGSISIQKGHFSACNVFYEMEDSMFSMEGNDLKITGAPNQQGVPEKEDMKAFTVTLALLVNLKQMEIDNLSHVHEITKVLKSMYEPQFWNMMHGAMEAKYFESKQAT